MGMHDRIIADAAKSVLQPLGFVRKGRSRVWLADHGWWLSIVEFQPSGFSKGSYLNVAAHWLWSESRHLTFDYGGRAGVFEKYVSDDQFTAVASRLTKLAKNEANALARAFSSVKEAAQLLLHRELEHQGQKGGGWSAYHAGVAAGLAGMNDDAKAMFLSVTDAHAQPIASKMASFLSDPDAFQREATSLIHTHRKSLGLRELDTGLFARG